MPTLTVLKGRRFDRELDFEKDNFFIGREDGNDLVLEDASISRVHAKFMHDASGWSIVDLNSTNGVYINNGKVHEMPIKTGDVIVLGEYTFIVRGLAAADASAVAPSESSYKTLDSLCLLARRFHGPVTLNEMLEAMTDSLLDVFRAERGFILLSGAKGELADPTVMRRRGELATPDARVQISKTVAARAVEERKAILITDVEADREFRGVESIEAEQVRSIICCPLIQPGVGISALKTVASGKAATRSGLTGECLGVVYLDSRMKARAFTETDLDMLDRFVEAAGHLIGATRERELLRKSTQNFAQITRDMLLADCDTDRLVARSGRMAEVISQVKDAAAEDVTVLITGESGTGKELIAKAVHYTSRRAQAPFVAVNCMALSRELIESELFGHEKGAFSGAVGKKIGKFEQADGGTIFLDEIGEVSLDVQVKLLRVLQERRITPVGGTREVELDIRLVTATNRDLNKAVAQGQFREDFYYRINVFNLELPPLRDRREDVPALVEHFITLFNKKMGKQLTGADPDAMAALRAYDWPGNIRELRNVVERAFVVEKTRVLSLKSLPHPIVGGGPKLHANEAPQLTWPDNFDDAREVFEKHFIVASLKKRAGNVTLTAKETGLPRRTLYRRLEKYGIDPKELLSEEALKDMQGALDEKGDGPLS